MVSGRLFVGGFCWGGSKMWDFVVVCGDFVGVYVFYGMLLDVMLV